MERLTERHYKESSGYYMKCSETCHIECGEKSYCEEVDNIVDRLGAIEDILGDEYDMDRLRELVEADREGKIPKYTIGDTVYDRFGDGWEVDDAELHLLNEKPEWIYRCGHVGTYDYCALWEFEAFPTKEAALRREQDG